MTTTTDKKSPQNSIGLRKLVLALGLFVLAFLAGRQLGQILMSDV